MNENGNDENCKINTNIDIIMEDDIISEEENINCNQKYKER